MTTRDKFDSFNNDALPLAGVAPETRAAVLREVAEHFARRALNFGDESDVFAAIAEKLGNLARREESRAAYLATRSAEVIQ